MQVNLSEIMNRRDETVTQELPMELGSLVRCGVSYPVLHSSTVRLSLCSSGAKQVRVVADAKVTLKAECDRCLKEVQLPFVIHYDDEFTFSDNGETAEELDETSCICGFDLDVDRLIFEEMLLDFPTKILCTEACKGICKVCGADLNQGECGCDRTELDPRMAAFRDIFNKFKEV